MGKMYLKNFLIGMVFVGISAVIAAAIMALLSFLANLLTLPFNAIPTYIVGGVIGIACCFIFKRFFIEQNGYFTPEEIDNPKKGLFWINRIKNKNFVKKGVVQATYIPFFIISLAIIVFAGVFYSTLQSAGETSSYIGYAVICAVIGAAAVSLLMYGIFGIRSIKVCAKCGTVNAFIYDEYLDLNEASGFSGQSYNFGGGRGGIRVWAGGYDNKKFTKFGSRVSRHCACCGEQSVYTEKPEESKVVK